MNINFYMNQIESIPLLTAEEEKALATKAFSGDKNAQNELVKANLRFVVKVAKSYKGYETEDLINEGNLGLIRAAEKFNPECGTKFITYAVWWIKSYIQKSIRETATTIKFPANNYKEMKNPMWKMKSLYDEVKVEGNKKVHLISLIEDIKSENPEQQFTKKFFIEKLYEEINKLPKIEQYVLINHYGLHGKAKQTFSEIGKKLNLSKERIHQIEKSAICHLQ